MQGGGGDRNFRNIGSVLLDDEMVNTARDK